MSFDPNTITRIAVDHLRDAQIAVVVQGGAVGEFASFIGSFVRTKSEVPPLPKTKEAA
jgi:hypothetical protein